MLRIDEIYNNTFWTYIKHHIPLTRAFFCDPPGTSAPENLHNYGNNVTELNYIFFHDQEPVHPGIHKPLFQRVVEYNTDINNGQGVLKCAIVTSERNSEFVEQVCSQYKWVPYYYFHHGWAALDWYRGYDKTFLIKPANERIITRTFIAPNRIIAGERQHRLAMLYWIFKLDMTNNHISCPTSCPAENISIHDAVKQLKINYPDIESVFKKQPLPLQFKNETDHPMHSCWLSLFDQSAESLLYLVTETVATGRRHHLTEKTFKPIALGMPFVIVGTQGSLEYLRSYGFKTFGHLWDESYDTESDDVLRIEKIAKTLKFIDSLETRYKQQLFEEAHAIVKHNWDHFYNGGFEQILWQELVGMLNTIKQDFNR